MDDHVHPGFSSVFPRKYMPFFVEDFRWTSQNYRSMAARGAELRQAFAAAVQTWRQALCARQSAGVEPAPGSLELDIYS